MRKWIVHADDFGETQEITRGIVLGMESGMVSSTSIMANMPGTDDALGIASHWEGDQSFGVHLNFCEGTALSGASTLTSADGSFLPKRKLFLRAVTGRLRDEDVEREVRAQLDRVGSAGVKISHIDSHKHLHQLPVIRRVVARLLPKYGIDRVRSTREEGLWRRTQSPQVNAYRLVRMLMARQAWKLFDASGLRSPQAFIDIAKIMKNDSESPVQEVGADPGPVEVGCHPGTERAVEEKPGSCDRWAELQFLTSPRFRQILDANEISIVTYWDV